jgi:hypothetical protein
MKKFLVVFFLGLVIAGSAFAQFGGYNGYNQTAQAQQTVSGTLQVINGTLAVVSAGNQVCYVPNLQPYYGANGLCVNTPVTVCGTIANNSCSPCSFMAGGAWYVLPGCNHYGPQVQSQPTYFPPVQQPTYVPPIVVLVVPIYTTPPQGYYPPCYGR